MLFGTFRTLAEGGELFLKTLRNQAVEIEPPEIYPIQMSMKYVLAIIMPAKSACDVNFAEAKSHAPGILSEEFKKVLPHLGT